MPCGINCCGGVEVAPSEFNKDMINEQLKEVVGKLRIRGGGPKAIGEATNSAVAHCLESDLSPAQQLQVLETLEFTKLCELDIALVERHVGATLLVIQAMMGAIVPILIPFAEVYKDTVSNGVKVGMVLSIVATACSLLGSIAIAIEKARKFQETSYVGHDAAWAIYKEIELFLALAGPYEKFNSHKGAAWKKYAGKIADLVQERDARKNNVYGSSNNQAGVEVGKAEEKANMKDMMMGTLPGMGGIPGLPGNPMSMIEEGRGSQAQAEGVFSDAMQSAQGNTAQGGVQNAQGAAQGAVQNAQGAADGAMNHLPGAV